MNFKKRRIAAAVQKKNAPQEQCALGRYKNNAKH
jgi:hypothetical protein